MTVPIQIPWDLFHGKIVVWCECIAAGVRRAVLLPRLDTIFAPTDEDPTRELAYTQLDWRLVSPTETDWERYIGLVTKQAERARIPWRAQRVENMARWVGGQHVAVPQYHLWLYGGVEAGAAIERLYDTVDPEERRKLWRWLLSWTAPAELQNPVP